MTNLFRTTAAAIGLFAAIGAAHAQSLRDTDGPAEFPPASYTGNQYVDSKGCVYIRAGFGGNVTWVPRVNRSRDVVCGFRPTFAGDNRPPAVQPPPTAVATLPPPSDPPSTSAPPVRTVTTTTVVATTPPPRVQATVPPPRTRVVAPPPTVVVVAPPVVSGACPELSPLAQQYIRNGHEVRCLPHGGLTYRVGEATNVLVVPPSPAIKPPPGYKPAWEDDRLNRHRGHVTLEGFVQMRTVWTGGVPRKLVKPGNERFPVVNAVPNEDREFSAVTKRSTAVISTKGVEPPAAGNGHRFVQVGAFSTDADARAVAAGLQRKGLPVRLSRASSGGRSVVVVLAGPFGSAAALQSGLTTVRGTGYSGAFTRR